MTRHDIGYIARTVLPMFALMVLMVVILVVVPDFATWRPETMRTRPGR